MLDRIRDFLYDRRRTVLVVCFVTAVWVAIWAPYALGWWGNTGVWNTWPMAIFIYVWSVFVLLGWFKPTQRFILRLFGIHWNRFLGDAEGRYEWKRRSRLYWLIAFCGAVYAAIRVYEAYQLWLVALLAGGFVFWAAVFVKNSLTPPAIPLKPGHTVQYSARPHIIGFVPMMFRVGLLAVPKGGSKRLIRIIVLVRYLMGLGPLICAGLILVALQFVPQFIAEYWTYVLAAFASSFLWWAIFAVFGWLNIKYYATIGPDGDVDKGELGVRLPKLTILGVLSHGDTVDRSKIAAAETQEVLGPVVHIDPKMEFTIGIEKVKYWFVDIRTFPIIKR